MNKLFILSSVLVITIAKSAQVNSDSYMKCLTNSCSSYINNDQSHSFFQCTNSLGNCMISQVFSTTYSQDFNSNDESACINTCTGISSQVNPQYQQFYNDLSSCTLSCIEKAKNDNDTSISFNVPIFVIVIGIIFVIIICYIVYYFFNRKGQSQDKFDWQIQQENNARNEQQFIITPNPLPYLQEYEIYKSKTHPSQLKARVMSDQEVKELYEKAYKKHYGDEMGIQGTIQYAIPIYAFPPVKECNELIIQEAQIEIPEQNDQVVINIEALQSQKVQIKQKKIEHNPQENKDMCVINLQSTKSQFRDEEKLPSQEIKMQKAQSQKFEQKKCISVRKQSANYSRVNKNQNQIQQNLRRLTFV
ncbi:transmembrane protein, putative (macronuclear) [Tetrahymena thermophila SB210]|uniref:Transmembrane protein, putative n=1 Tax=Tetrahymena thermophila (strain SB210) TaxID=312017 RepID=I7MA69_TETTS|nr:transmembrane protein, putative [Tetrahymena thermophila SB210]EAS03822.3 transmembrane protein, putative [Tetrahymena thermophila SB210]|eukprot:XP_001024067.3 transmembrane protein, putative [Tetrahymena thermophila SB210]